MSSASFHRRLTALAILWLLLVRFAGPFWLWLLPAPLLAQLDLPSFSMLAQATATLLGLALASALLGKPWATLGFRKGSKLGLAGTLLVAPALFVFVSTVALEIAMPWLLEELAEGRAQASRENAGELGRAIREAPLLPMLLWGALFAAVAEELCFRGALWSAVRQGALRIWPRAELASGLLATLMAAALFGLMHADMPGGVGVVRLVATTLVGVACGVARQLSGTLLAPILLHLAHNVLTIGMARKWLDDGNQPLVGVLPNRLLLFAALGLVTTFALFIQRRAISQRAQLL